MPEDTTPEVVPAPADPGPDIEALLRFDPFEQEPETPAEETAPTAEATPPETPPTPPTPATPPAPDHAERLAQAAELLAAAAHRTPAPAQPPTASPTPADDLPDYQFNIPVEIVNGLYADDPNTRQQALVGLLRGYARAIHREVRAERVRHINEDVIPSLRKQSEEATNLATIRNDFYGTYPQLNTPWLQMLVVEELPLAAKETGSNGWGPKLKEKLYERVQARLKSMMPAAEVPPPTPPVQPPAVRGGSSARPAGGPTSTSKDDIVSTLW